MKKISFIFLIAALFFIGCDDDGLYSDNDNKLSSDIDNELSSDTNSDINDGFSSDIMPGGVWMKMGDGMVVGTSDIDYYVASTHTFFLKSELPYLEKDDPGRSFSVFVDEKEIYNCVFHSMLSSSIPSGNYIYYSPYFYPKNILSIAFSSFSYGETNVISDLRNDPRIIEALKKYNQYHEGMYFEIQSVTKSKADVTMTDGLNNSDTTGLSGKIKWKWIMTGELYNPDTFDYYYLDPDKMAFGLFHYFTNGLSLYSYNLKKTYSSNVAPTQPDPWNAWDMKWLSLIKSGERKKISLTYYDFDEVQSGNYKAFFSFPRLSSQLKQTDIQQADGQIWVGELFVTKDIIVE